MENKKSKTPLIIGIVAVVAVIAVILGIVLIKGKGDKAYRVIKVYEISGTATITREGIGDIDAYENMVLESGDSVYTKEGTMTLKLDEDKFIVVAPETKLSLVATGNAENSKTTIDLQEGAILNDIQNKLNEDSSYEINTPNSTMAVRGTMFSVETYIGDDGLRYTDVIVFEGIVETQLVCKDGTVTNLQRVEAGKEVLIYQDDVNTDYVNGGPFDIDYSHVNTNFFKYLTEDGAGRLPEDVLNKIQELKAALLSSSFTVTFMYNGNVFGTQTVANGATAVEPSIMPAPSGGWDFDFSTPIEEDTVINWK